MHALVLGVTLGLGAGLAPGPLMAVVIRATLEGGFAAGARVALRPAGHRPADRAVRRAAGHRAARGGARRARRRGRAVRPVPGRRGAARRAGARRGRRSARPRPTPPAGSLRRGAVVNLLNPHPWVFWITVGAPILGDAGPAGAVAFLVPFYALLIGAKILLAAGLGAGRERLVRGRGHALALRAAGALDADSPASCWWARASRAL